MRKMKDILPCLANSPNFWYTLGYIGFFWHLQIDFSRDTIHIFNSCKFQNTCFLFYINVSLIYNIYSIFFLCKFFQILMYCSQYFSVVLGQSGFKIIIIFYMFGTCTTLCFILMNSVFHLS